MLREPSSGYSSNCHEAIFGVQKASLSMVWEYSPSSANIVSDWLRAESSPADEEEIQIKMDDSVDTSLASSILHSLRSKLTYLLTCGRCSLVSGTQNDIVVS